MYIISNLGSFGEHVYKVGMTRRLEPMERVRELGDASVPFPFDVHAMLYSENAPELESALHRFLDKRRVNLINPRKEFFRFTLEEITQFAQAWGVQMECTTLAEAKEYRETMALRQPPMTSEVQEAEGFPRTLFADDSIPNPAVGAEVWGNRCYRDVAGRMRWGEPIALSFEGTLQGENPA